MVDETNVEGDQFGTIDTDDIPYAIGYVKGKFTEAEDGRRESEIRWQKAYKNYRGVLDGTTSYTATEKSKVFVKITKVKVLAAYGQITDILFANGKIPIYEPGLNSLIESNCKKKRLYFSVDIEKEIKESGFKIQYLDLL